MVSASTWVKLPLTYIFPFIVTSFCAIILSKYVDTPTTFNEEFNVVEPPTANVLCNDEALTTSNDTSLPKNVTDPKTLPQKSSVNYF